MSEIIDNLSRACSRKRAGIIAITFVPCDGLTYDITEMLVSSYTQTKVAKTITLDINSGKAMSTKEGERANFTTVRKEEVTFTHKDDEAESELVIESLVNGLHFAIVTYANGKNKLYGGKHGMMFNDVTDSGTEGTDLNGIVVTGTAESEFKPPLVSNTDLDTIKSFTV